MQAKDYRDLFILAAIWGSSFLFMRLSIEAFGPFALVEVRVGLGAIFLLIFAALRGKLGAIKPHIRRVSVVGILPLAYPSCASTLLHRQYPRASWP